MILILETDTGRIIRRSFAGVFLLFAAKSKHRYERKRKMKSKAESRAEEKAGAINWVEQAEPILSGLMNGWHLIPVGNMKDEVNKILNIDCGIDYLLYSEVTRDAYGVAVRVQFGKNYRTFTVPKERESGTKTAGLIFPYYTMQVYIDGERLIGLGLVKTVDLMSFIDRGFASNKTGKFHVCHFDDLRLAGYTVKEFLIEQNASEPKKAYHGRSETLEDLMHDIDDCGEYDICDICDMVAQTIGKNVKGYAIC